MANRLGRVLWLGLIAGAAFGQPGAEVAGQPPAFELIWPLPATEPAYPTVRMPITLGWNPSPEELERQRFEEALREALGRALAPHATLDEAFTPIERSGLVAQLTSLSASLSVNHRQWGRGGVQQQRTLTLSGALTDMSGSRAFRIVGSPRILELTDQDGVDLIPTATWSVYPDASSPQPFTRPSDSPGSMAQQGWSFSTGDIAALPARLGTLRIEILAAIADESQSGTFRAVVTPEFQELAPGLEARVTMLTVEGGQTRLGVEYRVALDREGQGGPWFLRADVLDDEMRLLQTAEGAQEAQTRDSVIGSVAFWGIDTSTAPAWHIRLHFVPTGHIERFELVERGLPMLGGE